MHTKSETVKELLVFSWEYPEVSSRQGTALARRVGQVAQDFIRNGWHVTVVHRDHVNEVSDGKGYCIINKVAGLTRIAVKGRGIAEYNSWESVPLLRQLHTLIISLQKGDRSYYWASKAIEILQKVRPSESFHPDLIISFFTPRGPLNAGKFASKYYHTPWIADFQDSIDEGYKNFYVPITSAYMKHVVNTATAITHVSPEWAERDGKLIGREINTIRHAIPTVKNSDALHEKTSGTDFSILYAGSIDPVNQSPDVFAKVYNRLRSEQYPVKLLLAGSEKMNKVFADLIEDHSSVEYKGWLTAFELERQIRQVDSLLVIPWSTSPRMVIPSKFYEFMAYDKPVWIIGNDTGSFNILLKELGHPLIEAADLESQYEAMKKLIAGDSKSVFHKKQCRYTSVQETDLYKHFIELLS